jgi:hypothetical protein
MVFPEKRLASRLKGMVVASNTDMKKFILLLALCTIPITSAETDGSKLTDDELAAKLATKVPTPAPGVKTRSIMPQDARTRSGAISPEAYQKTRSAIDLAKVRAVRLNLGTPIAQPPPGNKSSQPAEKILELACPVSMASGVAFRLRFKLNQDIFVDPVVAGKELDKIAHALKTFVDSSAGTAAGRIREQFLIEGHTCDRGDDLFNQLLSEKRAMAVREQLLTRGVPSEMLLVLGQGESYPEVENSSESNRALNRRVAVFRVGEKLTAK